ncbi:ATP-dependent Clp protease ATP-binding subunit [uncultured Methanobrevibacter sp.]|uniref:ATP-dependent Clp protease ATP-binding subunit n=1 Tax=uncultured Methanobrevibacter sp. TaxID=253161 RepID=UPI0026183199|nr:ATP-dependent Clp protease ATP-binding subunit [uncultured Methanobrevibacter sp.]
MVRLSKCVYLAEELGSAEAINLKQELFSEDELLIGICSLEKIVFLLGENQVNYNEDYANFIKFENDEITDFFKKFNIKLSSIRRGIRELKGEGENESETQMIPRSDSCKSIIDDARKIAESTNSDEVRCIHIIKAILNNPSDIIKTFFEDHNIEFEELKTNLNIEKETNKLKLSSNSVLMNYGTNLTDLAKEGKLTPVIGRDDELLQVIRTLNKRKKNNPLIIGEPGVGKTALVNGLAIKITDGSMKNLLKDKQIIEINMASLVAGTKYRGEFEEKITKLVNESKENPEVILFVDEIHTIFGAGSASGSMDASNIIKPALANGDLVMIGATTLQEYRKYFETDPAFERRFQPVILEEPTPEDTLFILKGLKPNYEEYHNVTLSDEAIEAAVNLSVRYITDRNLPDKALDVIDEACSRKLIPKLDITNSLNIESVVSEEDVKTVVSEWTGVPISDESSQFEKAQKIEEFLKSKIIGQDQAIEKVSRRIKNSYAGINNPDKPLAVFLFLGPTGVGKTYFSKTLANFLFGSEKSLIRVDMSEYKEEHSISKLIGAPPGYKGNDEGGFLTNAIKNNPYSIVLLDEIEKGHPKVFDVFLQAFDEGRLTDGKGNTVNAKNCIFIMTSNMEIETKQDYNVAFGGTQEDMNTMSILDNLAQVMRPELVNRIDDVIIFNSLTKSDNESLVKLYVDDLAQRLMSEKSINLSVKKSVYKFIVKKGYNVNFGARYLKRTVEKLLEYPISDMIVNREVKEGDTIVVSAVQNELEFKVK